MKISEQSSTNTKASYKLTAESSDIEHFKQAVASSLSSNVKVPGFRPNKAPTEMIFKYADQNELQTEFLNHAVGDLYAESQKLTKFKIVGRPAIEITKFVPFTALEVKVEVPIVSNVKLPDYSKINLTKKFIKVTDQLVNKNITELQKRSASQVPVKRAIKKGDMVVIDFEGSDSSTKLRLPMASAKDFNLIIGDQTLIPGFEEQLVGMTINKTKSFDLVFPANYPDKTFSKRKVTFKVTIKQINRLNLPKLDDKFAATIGPFKSVNELRQAIKQQLQAENDRQSTIDLENQILKFLADNVEVEIDESLIESEFNMLLNEAKQAAVNRGQTWQEFLSSIGLSEDQYLKQLKESAIHRIKGGLAIGEIAEKENITISDNELNAHISNLKSQYSDETMLKELDNPANRRELASRLLTEKVLDFIQRKIVDKNKS